MGWRKGKAPSGEARRPGSGSKRCVGERRLGDLWAGVCTRVCMCVCACACECVLVCMHVSALCVHVCAHVNLCACGWACEPVCAWAVVELLSCFQPQELKQLVGPFRERWSLSTEDTRRATLL